MAVNFTGPPRERKKTRFFCGPLFLFSGPTLRAHTSGLHSHTMPNSIWPDNFWPNAIWSNSVQKHFSQDEMNHHPTKTCATLAYAARPAQRKSSSTSCPVGDVPSVPTRPCISSFRRRAPEQRRPSHSPCLLNTPLHEWCFAPCTCLGQPRGEPVRLLREPTARTWPNAVNSCWPNAVLAKFGLAKCGLDPGGVDGGREEGGEGEVGGEENPPWSAIDFWARRDLPGVPFFSSDFCPKKTP